MARTTILLITTCLVMTTAARAQEKDFADVGLARDAQAVLDGHQAVVQKRLSGSGAEEGCVRGEPSPWISRKDRLDGTHAWRRVAPTAALETFVREDGASITILDWGCESYVASIRWVFPNKPPVQRFPLRSRVIEALRELQRIGAKSVFGLDKVEAALTRHKDPDLLLRSGDELPVPGDGEEFLQTRVVLTGAGTLDAGAAGYVELRLIKGPL